LRPHHGCGATLHGIVIRRSRNKNQRKRLRNTISQIVLEMRATSAPMPTTARKVVHLARRIRLICLETFLQGLLHRHTLIITEQDRVSRDSSGGRAAPA
jgi:hypothetical protein